jgi:hypothetical protein
MDAEGATPQATPEVVTPTSAFGPQTLAIAAFSFASLLVARMWCLA